MSWENPESDEPSTLSPATRIKKQAPSISPEQNQVQLFGHCIESALADHPQVAPIITRLVVDKTHQLDLTRAIENPGKAKETFAILSELADGYVLQGRTLEEYTRRYPGKGPLFEVVAPEINITADGRNRKSFFIGECKKIDSARTVGPNPGDSERELVNDYARRLRCSVDPAVRNELKAFASKFDGASLSIRTKIGSDILDKVERMTRGSERRPARPDYQVGDVVDAVGGRVTVTDTRQLADLLQAAKEHFDVGDNGRILEIENMYAAPKSGNNDYRVIPLIISTEISGQPYTYELQLMTRRASIAADLCHNTIYKPYVPTTEVERSKITQMSAEAAALDQQETRRSSHGV